MAKTRFTEIRLERITKHLEFEMWCVLQAIANNQRKFEKGEQTARQALANHRKNVELFLRHDRNYGRAIRAANRIDRCENDEERYLAAPERCRALNQLWRYCEFFEK